MDTISYSVRLERKKTQLRAIWKADYYEYIVLANQKTNMMTMSAIKTLRMTKYHSLAKY